MKKINGNKSENIITDEDVVITSDSGDIGNNLKDILSHHDDEINKLKSNVKFIYKYGGVGSGGSGGGGGNNDSGSIYAVLDGKTQLHKNMGTIIIDNSNGTSHTLKLSARGSLTNTEFTVKVTYDNKTYSGAITLNESNSWTAEINIDLTTNNTLGIEYTNRSTMASDFLSVEYIVNAYNFGIISYSTIDGLTVFGSENEIYHDDIKDNGLRVFFNYEVNVSGIIKYRFTIDDKNVTETKTIEITSKETGVIEHIITPRPSDGSHTVKVDITFQLGNNVSTITLTSIFMILSNELALSIKPDNIASKLFDSSGEIPSEENQFQNQNPISLDLRVYQGRPITRTGKLSYTIDDVEIFSIDIEDGKSYTISFTPSYNKNGWLKIAFTYTLGSLNAKTTIKYLYINVVKTALNWWWKNNDQKNPSLYNYFFNKSELIYYRIGEYKGDNVPVKTVIKNSSETEDTNFGYTFTKDDSHQDFPSFIINIGIQYSKNNNESNPIIKFDSTESNSIDSKNGLYIYQNKITFGGKELSIYINEEDSSTYSSNTNTNYHLLTIALRRICSNKNGTSNRFELSAYMDGVLEGVCSDFINGSMYFDKIAFKPGNYCVNLLEMDYISRNYSMTDNNNNVHIPSFDNDIVYYYYTYWVKLNNKDIDYSLLSILMENMPNIRFKDGLLSIPSNVVIGIARSTKIPMMIVQTYSGDERTIPSRTHTVTTPSGNKVIKNIYEWLNSSYSEKTEGEGTDIKDYACRLDNVRWLTPGASQDFDLGSSIVDNDVNSFFTDKSGETLDNKGFAFFLELQGSSTMNFKSKNFTLGIRNIDNESNQKYFYSPNFSSNENGENTYLPEDTFTLKADVIDSSHTNNVCIGNFVNNNSETALNYGANANTWFKNMISVANGIDDDFQKKYIKKCLTGFPFYMILEIKDNAEKPSEYYFLGVYNFNLGRSSSYNLGYKKLKRTVDSGGNISGNMPDSIYNAITNGYETPKNKFTIISKVTDEFYVNGFITAEIQGNTQLWDFSQYGKSILFQGVGNNAFVSNFMFGDIKHSTASENTYLDDIQSMVKSVANAGAYIFREIGKKQDDIMMETNGTNGKNYYTIPGTVPSIEYQYKRTGENTFVLDDEVNKSLLNGGEKGSYINNLRMDALTSCIYTDAQDNVYKKINYESLIFYYTTCMAFGMVDSVQKNLTIKSWTGGNPSASNFGVFFYDMDTCLGLANDGSDTDYFSFSDYYKTETATNSEDETVYDVKNSIILRDYFPIKGQSYQHVSSDGKVAWTIESSETSKLSGYDIPSSYLFAIAKYAWSVLGDDAVQYIQLNPSQIWYNLRFGDLLNSETFINKYFKGYTDKVDDALFNFDYREKYLSWYGNKTNENGQSGEWLDLNYDMTEGTMPNSYNTVNIKPFKGRRIFKVKDWLNKRIHLLDFYFGLNVIKNANSISNLSDSSLDNTINIGYKEAYPTYTTGNDNNDIIITNGIFGDSGNGLQRSAPVDIIVQAEDYSPLIIKNGSVYSKYVLSDSESKYHFNIAFTGSALSSFGGAKAWTSIKSFNTLISSLASSTNGITIDSDKITEIIADEKAGELSGTWDINANKVTNLSLTSSKFSGKLGITKSNMASLSDIDISNTKISLDIDGLGLNINTLKAQKLQGADSLIITNAETIKKMDITGQIKEARFTAWDNNGYTLPTNLLINNFTITAKNGSTDAILTIKNSTSLSRLTFSGFKTIIITNCPELSEINCNDQSDNSILSSITITSCPKITSLSLPVKSLSTINLYNDTKLSSLEFRGVPSKTDLLQSLDLRHSLVETINWSDSIMSKYNNSYDGHPVMDLSYYTSNFAFNIANNNNVQVVRLKNERNNPNNNIGVFTNCSNLMRVFGYFKVKSSMFYSCKKFSIHGTGKWHGKNLLDNYRTKHPYEFFGTEYSKNYDCFSEGTEVTNMLFDDNINSAFYTTKCTIFDAYYTFYVGSNITDANNSFRSIGQGVNWSKDNINECAYYKFFWYKALSVEVDNSPNVHLFTNCPKLANISLLFYGDMATTIKIADELIKPLTELTDASWFFRSCIISQNVLKYSTKITTIDVFTPSYITGDYNPKDLTYDDIESVKTMHDKIGNRLGKFSKLFNSLTNVVSLNMFLTNIKFLNYGNENWDVVIPKSVTGVRRSFNADQGIGTLPTKLCNLFEDPSTLLELDSSFIVTSPSKFNSDFEYDESDNEYKVRLNISNELFTGDNKKSGFDNLQRISFCGSNGMTGDYRLNESNSFCSSFNGKGLDKVIINGEFPYDIISNMPNLALFTGFFMDTKIDDNNPITDITLPNRMFTKAPNLTNVDYCFANVQFTYELSESSYTNSMTQDNEASNFANCPNISRLRFTFANDIPIDIWNVSNGETKIFIHDKYDNTDNTINQTTAKLNGMIPHHFFWHGSIYKQTIHVGTDNDDEYKNVINGDTIIDDSWINSHQITITYEIPNTNITNIEGCFMHSNLHDSYRNDNPLLSINTDYVPFKYIYKNNKLQKNNSTAKKYELWDYDGYSLPSQGLEEVDFLDELDYSQNENVDWFGFAWDGNNINNSIKSLNFFCPPDLLRYCKNNTTLNINYLFYHSGMVLSTWYQINKDDIITNEYGINGRIPPYLFKPVSKITSLRGFFNNCKCLTGYGKTVNNNTENTFIPSTLFSYCQSVNDLSYLFEGLCVPSNVTIGGFENKNFMSGLNFNNPLTLDKMFYKCRWGNDADKKVIVSQLFSKFTTIKSAKNIFAQSDSDLQVGSTSYGTWPEGYVDFSNGNFNTKYANDIYGTSDKGFVQVYAGFINSNTIYPSTRDLPDNTNTLNYANNVSATHYSDATA